jgi:hypothetical protein
MNSIIETIKKSGEEFDKKFPHIQTELGEDCPQFKLSKIKSHTHTSKIELLEAVVGHIESKMPKEWQEDEETDFGRGFYRGFTEIKNDLNQTINQIKGEKEI